MPARAACCCLFVLLWAALFSSPVAGADEPLHKRIDALVAAKAGDAPLGPKSSDAEFVRRIYLDLAGRIPSAGEVKAFLDDPDPDKRQKLIDKLLAAPGYAAHLSGRFHVMLMERRGEHELWQKYLYDSFAANKPWDKLVAEILAADDADEKLRGSAFFYAKRLDAYGQNPIDYPGLTRDVGRMFLGRDLQCAQCHNDLFVDEYKQIDFQGLFAVYSNLELNGGTKHPAVKEKPLTKKLQFVSVFDPTQRETGPRLPNGREFSPPQDAKNMTPGLLKLISAELPRGDDTAFKQNIANRLWWLMLGRGLVRPLDRHHGGNPPSHPELLKLLGDEFAGHQFDIKWLLRELALSEAYQRTGHVPADEAKSLSPTSYRYANERPLSAEQLWASTLQAIDQCEWDERLLPKGRSAEQLKAAEELKKRFVTAFAAEARESEEELGPSVKGALFLSHDQKFLDLFAVRDGNLIERLNKQSDTDKLTDELYLAVLTRSPTDDERRDAKEYLAKREADRPNAIGQLVWALLTSTEFFVNH